MTAVDAPSVSSEHLADLTPLMDGLRQCSEYKVQVKPQLEGFVDSWDAEKRV